MVMKFCGWIDLIKGECSAHEPQLLLASFLSCCPLFIVILEFCPELISKTTSYSYEILWVDQGGVQCT